MPSQDRPSVGPPTTINPENNDAVPTHVRRRPSRRDTATPVINTTDARLSRYSYYTTGTDRTSSYTTATSEGDYESALEGETSEMEDEFEESRSVFESESPSTSRSPSPGLEMTTPVMNPRIVDEGRRGRAISVASQATARPLSVVPPASYPFPSLGSEMENTEVSDVGLAPHQRKISDTIGNGDPFTTPTPSIRSLAISHSSPGTGTPANGVSIPFSAPPLVSGVKGSPTSSQTISTHTQRAQPTSYMRAPNPPMTAVTRHRRLSSSGGSNGGSVKGNPLSSTAANSDANANNPITGRASGSNTNISLAGLGGGYPLALPNAASASPNTAGGVSAPYHGSSFPFIRVVAV